MDLSKDWAAFASGKDPPARAAMDSDDDMFDVFDQPAPKALTEEADDADDAAAAPAAAEQEPDGSSKKRKADSATSPAATKRTAAAGVRDDDPTAGAQSREYQMLDLCGHKQRCR